MNNLGMAMQFGPLKTVFACLKVPLIIAYSVVFFY